MVAKFLLKNPINFFIKERKLAFIFKIFLVLVLIAVIFRYWNHGYESIIGSDGKGYYAYLPGTFIFQDLNFDYFFNGLLNIDRQYTSSFLYTIEGEAVIKYSAGVAFLQLPFFALACLTTYITGGVLDGYSFWFQIFVSLSTIFYTSLGLYCIYSLLETYNVKDLQIKWVIILIVFGTNLTLYAVYDSAMSHAYSFSMMSILLLNARKYFISENKWSLFLCAFAIGSIVLIRSINIIILLAIPALFDNFTQLWGVIQRLVRQPLTILISALIIIAIISVQPLMWYLQTGKFYVWTYLGEWFNFSNPKFFKALFSYRKGWLLYTPAMLLLIPSFFEMIKQKLIVQAIFIFLTFSLSIYFISTWWCWYFGGSFGQRSMIEFYSLASIPIGIYFSKNWTKRKIIIPILCIFIILNLIQSYQYKNNILHYDAMTKEKYWKVFLKTSDKYKWSVFKNPNDIIDKDLTNRLKIKSFYEFDYIVDAWKPFINTDISDDALSGNKVLDFSLMKENQKFELKHDSFSSSNNLRMRFKAWFVGNPAAIDCKLYLLNNLDTIYVSDLSEKWKDLKIKKENWNQYEIDIPLSTFDKFTKLEIILRKSQSVILMDDAMIYIYE